MRELSIVIASLIIGALLVIAFQDGCSKPHPISTSDSARYWKAYGDSAAAASRNYAQQLDLTIEENRLKSEQWAKDSLKLIARLAIKDTAVNVEKRKFSTLSIQYQTAIAKGDTGSRLTICDSAFRELARAKVAVTDLQGTYDSTLQSFGQELSRRDSVIAAITGVAQGFRRTSDALISAGAGQSRIITTLTRQVNKKWSLGGGVGVFVTAGGFTWGAGLTVHRDIFRF